MSSEHPLQPINYGLFLTACSAILGELEYQDHLPRRTTNEAKDVAAFATLARVYLRKLEDVWAMNPGTLQEDGSVQVTESLHYLRKLAAILVRAMIYNGVIPRTPPESP